MTLMSRATHVLQWVEQKVAIPRGGANLTKITLSSDWSLQFDSMKLKSLVIAYQNDAVNTFSDLVHTARQAMKAVCTRKHIS